jgi:hypothetical protein
VKVSPLVVLAAMAAVVPSLAGGFAVADQFSTFGWIADDDRAIHIALALAASVFSAAASGVGAVQLEQALQAVTTGQQRQAPRPGRRAAHLPAPTLGAVLCLFSAPALFVGTVLPYETSSQGTYTLLNFQDTHYLWGGVVGWWIPIILLMLVSAGTLVPTATSEWQFVSGGMLIAFGIGLLAGFISLFVYTPGAAAPGGEIGTVGGVIATVGGFMAILR